MERAWRQQHTVVGHAESSIGKPSFIGSLPASMYHLKYGPQSSKTVPPSGNQVFKHMRL